MLRAIRYVDELEVRRVDIDADLFLGFSDGRFGRQFALFDVTRRNLIIAVLISGIASTRNEDLPLFLEE